jgi:hypothetical protein
LVFLTLSGIGRCSLSQEPQTDKLPTEFSIAGDILHQDPDAKRFQNVFEAKLVASDRLCWWGRASYLLPENGVRICLYSTQVKGEDGQILGSAVVLTAARRSPKDAEAETLIDVKNWFVRHDASVDGTVQTYIDQLAEKLRS